PSAHGLVPWGKPGPINPPLVRSRGRPRPFAGEARTIVCRNGLSCFFVAGARAGGATSRQQAEHQSVGRRHLPRSVEPVKNPARGRGTIRTLARTAWR